MTGQRQEDLNEDLDKLGKFVQKEIEEVATKTHLSMKELMEIIEEVNIVKLHEAAHEALKKISYAVDLTPHQIFEVFTDHREAPLEDIVKRLHAKCCENRSKF